MASVSTVISICSVVLNSALVIAFRCLSSDDELGDWGFDASWKQHTKGCSTDNRSMLDLVVPKGDIVEVPQL